MVFRAARGLSPDAIGKVPEGSSGAVANALEKLVGDAVRVGDKPKKYLIADGTTSR